MRQIAANKLLVNRHTILRNGVIVLDDAQNVTDVFSLDDKQTESANTLFYNGLLTTDISAEKRQTGNYIPDLVEKELWEGYSGKLLVWTSLDLSELKITESTKVIEL